MIQQKKFTLRYSKQLNSFYNVPYYIRNDSQHWVIQSIPSDELLEGVSIKYLVEYGAPVMYHFDKRHPMNFKGVILLEAVIGTEIQAIIKSTCGRFMHIEGTIGNMLYRAYIEELFEYALSDILSKIYECFSFIMCHRTYITEIRDRYHRSEFGGGGDNIKELPIAHSKHLSILSPYIIDVSKLLEDGLLI